MQALAGSPASRVLDTWEILELVKVSGMFRTVQSDKKCVFLDYCLGIFCFSFTIIGDQFLHKH